jgi:hypothetical protein
MDNKDYIIGVLVIIIILMLVCIYSVKAKYKDVAPMVNEPDRSLAIIPVNSKNIHILGPIKKQVYVSMEKGETISFD